MMKVVKPMKVVMGVEPSVGSEWDAYLFPAFVHRNVRVTVRCDANGWTVYALGRKGAKVLAQWEIAKLQCETCAKALAYTLTGDDAACFEHDRPHPATVFDATVKVLLSLFGITPTDWAMLDEGARHRLEWTVREILDSKRDWKTVIRAWEAVEGRPEPLGMKVWSWHATLTFG